MSATAHKQLQHLAFKANLLAYRDDLLGTGSRWDPLHTLMEVALGAPLTTADGFGGTLKGQSVTDVELRLSAAKELAGYLYPKLKAVEHTVQGGEEPLRHAIVDDIANLVARRKIRGEEAPTQEG